MKETRVRIWVFPDRESFFSHKELADHLTITVATLQQRLRDMGPDNCLTFYPGNIPSRLRRMGKSNTKNRPKSTLSTIKNGRLSPDDLPRRICILFISKLVSRSKEDYSRFRCSSSRRFLLNEDGMLEYYLELMTGDDTDDYLEAAANFVHSQGR